MTKNSASLRSPLAQARGLGSAKSGVAAWLALRTAALILTPLSLYVVVAFLNAAVAGGYAGAVYWLQSPLSSGLVILFLLAGLYHGALGMKEVFEDYIPCAKAKMALIVATCLAASLLAIIGVLSVAKIFFGV